MSSSTRPPLRLTGARDLRSRLVLATLARRPVEIRRLRADAERPGLRGDEASFVRLLDKLTSGSRISIDETGTTLRYSPGTLCGGSIEHDCGPSGRPIGWFLSALAQIAASSAAFTSNHLRLSDSPSSFPSSSPFLGTAAVSLVWSVFPLSIGSSSRSPLSSTLSNSKHSSCSAIRHILR